MENQRPKVGIGIVLLKDSFVLLGKRKGAHSAGSWAFPGGHLEFGETPEECATRELAEETGMKALVIKRGPWTNDIFEGNKHYITLFMFVTEFLGTPKVLEPNKCDGWEWFEWNKLPKPLFGSIQSLIATKQLDHHFASFLSSF